MLNFVRAALLAAVALLPADVGAQAVPPRAPANQPIVLTPPDAPRWDTAFNIGWFGANRHDSSPGNNWFDAGAVDGSVGYYWTPHVKLDFAVAATSPGDVYVGEPISVPGFGFPQNRFREHRIRQTSGAIGVSYQFLENQSFHPFVGAGAMVVHELDVARRSEPWLIATGPQTWITLPPLPEESSESIFVRPFATVGFKAYFTERVFFRTDTRLVLSSGGTDSITWRVGFGVDF